MGASRRSHRWRLTRIVCHQNRIGNGNGNDNGNGLGLDNGRLLVIEPEPVSVVVSVRVSVVVSDPVWSGPQIRRARFLRIHSTARIVRTIPSVHQLSQAGRVARSTSCSYGFLLLNRAASWSLSAKKYAFPALLCSAIFSSVTLSWLDCS